MTETSPDILINEIMELIPHRIPMLLIDKVIDVKLGKSATGIKNVTMNEWFFQGHFPDHPVMPGVLIIEAMAQAAGVLVTKSMGQNSDGKIVYFMSIEEAKFRKPVVPGDTLKLKVTLLKSRGSIWKFKGEAWVEDVMTDEAIFTAMIANK
ncbi:MAG: 3-hydroxyacyl-ACP dehydratase FabZ [Candidatus Paracaedibacteraceae bacterium]|nr:3-hydroxyacyl-ACP dehydratase FabZ [Candidatus Paracaedibacteraceae bacterium]